MKKALLFLAPAAVSAHVWCGVAHADEPGNKAAAQALFEEGLRLFDAGRYPDACEKFAVSERLDAAASTLLNLARCYERAGRAASAWVTYGEAAAQAHREADPRREQYARERVADAAKRLSRLSILAPSAPPGTVVKRDGTPVDRAEWGVAVPVDPGPHVVEASAPGKAPWRTTLDVPKSPTSTTVEIPKLADAGAPPPASAADGTAAARSPPRGDGIGAQKIVALAVGGVGLVGVGVGTYFGLRAARLHSESQDHCPLPDACDPLGVSKNRDAGQAADVATIAVVAGAAALAAGVVLWLTAPSKNTRVGFSPAGVSAQF
jgi:tetratricopeptide (TPR) repeat protein